MMKPIRFLNVMVAVLLLLLVVVTPNMGVLGQEEEETAPQHQHQQQQQCEPCHCPVTVEELEQVHQNHANEIHRMTEESQQSCQQHLAEKEHEFHNSLQSCQSNLQSTLEQELQQQREQLQNEFHIQKEQLVADKNQCEEQIHVTEKSLRQIQNQFIEMKQKIHDYEAKKAVISFDKELFKERMNELLITLKEHWKVVQKYIYYGYVQTKNKCYELYNHFVTIYWPQIQTFYFNTIIPFCNNVVTTISTKWEQIYGPHREPINKKVSEIRTTTYTNYQQHIEPLVKQYKIDQYATQGKEKLLDFKYQVEVFAHQGHEWLIEQLQFNSKYALDYVKSQQGPDYIQNVIQTVQTDPELWATRIEYFVGIIFVLFFLKLFGFFGKKKKKSSKKSSSSKSKTNGHDKKGVTFKNPKDSPTKKKKKLY